MLMPPTSFRLVAGAYVQRGRDRRVFLCLTSGGPHCFAYAAGSALDLPFCQSGPGIFSRYHWALAAGSSEVLTLQTARPPQ